MIVEEVGNRDYFLDGNVKIKFKVSKGKKEKN